ncbi:MAG: DNA replication/repair protein RecF [Gammaproteobacteria bacterium]
MAVTQLNVQRFRCVDLAQLNCSPHENLIVGRNASGKTTLLESLFFLGHGRSFRGTPARGLIQDQTDDFVLFAKLSQPDGQLGIQGSKKGVTVKIDGSRAHSRSSLVSRLPVQVIEPGIHKLIEEGPTQRRSYLDWGVFHVEQMFYSSWRRYRKALDQRNAGLKEHLPAKEIALWNDTLIAAGEAVNQQRLDYLAKLAPFLDAAGMALFDTPLECAFYRGWSEDYTLAEAMAANYERDKKLARTHAGPHRADIRVRFGARMAKARVSRGQQKLIAAGLILAQLALFEQSQGKPAVLLIDDPAAELDSHSLGRLLEYARDIPAQRFITALEQRLVATNSDARVFHVEHGKVESLD